MMRSTRVRRLPLRGADVVLMAHHPRWQGVGLGHNTMLVVECDGPIESDRIERAWDRFLDVCPWPAARLRRPFPWGKLHWAAGPRASLTRPPLRRVTIAACEARQHELETELNAALEPRREAPVRMLIVDDESTRATPSSVLVLTWFHPLMDARGGENLLTHLNELDRHVEATFGNHLAFHFARFRSSETADVPALARALRRQMAEAVRDGQIEASEVALQFLQYRPLSRMLQVLPWTTGGELFSFNCADLADWPCALAECFGRKVLNAYHVPVVPPRPGIGVFFNRCAGRNNLVVSWIEGVVSDAEAARIIEVIREGMGWTGMESPAQAR
jgi:hypothetical protein